MEQNHRERMRSEFASRPAKRNRTPLLAAAAVLLSAAGVYYAAARPGKEAAAAPVPVQAEIVIPLSQLSEKASFFEHTVNGKRVRFFALRSSDGVYRAALDACDVCYEARQGYQQAGDDMVCRKCGRRFPSVKINDVTGGCNPVAVQRTVRDGNLVIAASDLAPGANYF